MGVVVGGGGGSGGGGWWRGGVCGGLGQGTEVRSDPFLIKCDN